MTIKEHAAELVKLSVTELLELVKVLKDDYGLEMKTTVEVATKEEVEEVAEVKTSVTVTLTKIPDGAQKLSAVKVINNFTQLGLKPSMDLTKSLPSVIKENVPIAEAEAFKSEMAALEAIIELN
jgi:large subunit ribosomal protein L7/L12